MAAKHAMRRRRSRFIAFRGQHWQNLISRNESLISRKLESRDSMRIRANRQTDAVIPRRFTSSTKADRTRRRQVRNVMKISLNRPRVRRITRVDFRKKISLKHRNKVSRRIARVRNGETAFHDILRLLSVRRMSTAKTAVLRTGSLWAKF